MYICEQHTLGDHLSYGTICTFLNLPFAAMTVDLAIPELSTALCLGGNARDSHRS